MKFINLFKKIFLSKQNQKSNHFFYRISKYENFNIKFQCVNSRVEFNLNLESIIHRKDILYRLNPLNACFLGVEYEKYSQFNQNKTSNKITETSQEYDFLLYRYGKYKMHGKNNRTGDIIFINNETNEEISMSPIEIAKTDELISEFDAAQAFAIGVEAAYMQFKEKNKKIIELHNKNKRIHLKIVEQLDTQKINFIENNNDNNISSKDLFSEDINLLN